LSLCTLLRKYRSMVQIFFPTEAEWVISIDVLKKILKSEPQTDDDKNTLQFFIRYLEEVSKRKEGIVNCVELKHSVASYGGQYWLVFRFRFIDIGLFTHRISHVIHINE
jgi:hypothetical protein